MRVFDQLIEHVRSGSLNLELLDLLVTLYRRQFPDLKDLWRLYQDIMDKNLMIDGVSALPSSDSRVELTHAWNHAARPADGRVLWQRELDGKLPLGETDSVLMQRGKLKHLLHLMQQVWVSGRGEATIAGTDWKIQQALLPGLARLPEPTQATLESYQRYVQPVCQQEWFLQRQQPTNHDLLMCEELSQEFVHGYLQEELELAK